MKKKAIVILNYNDYNTTLRLLKKIQHYNFFDAIIIVDNCSSDDSFEILKKYKSDKIRVIKTPNNGGYAKGNNFGIRYAINELNVEYIYVANPDILFEENVAEAMLEYYEKNTMAGILAPLVDKGYNAWSVPGILGTLKQQLLFTFTIEKKINRWRVKNKKKPIKVGVIEGSFFLISKKVYLEIGGFDESTFLYGEENILGNQLKKRGYEEILLPFMTYQHIHSTSIKKAYGSKVRAYTNCYASFKIYLEKYLKASRCEHMLFELFYQIGRFERMIYDMVYRLR